MKALSPLPPSTRSRPRVGSLKPRGCVWTDDELLHGAIISRLLTAVGNHVFEHKLGEVFDGQTGFRLGIDHCFEPDISFVSRRRMKVILPDRGKLFHGAPDLAVEVLTPADSITQTERKLQLCLAFGSSLAWMVDPKTQTVRVYRPSEETKTVRGSRFLTGSSFLPGFRISLGRLFEPLGN